MTAPTCFECVRSARQRVDFDRICCGRIVWSSINAEGVGLNPRKHEQSDSASNIDISCIDLDSPCGDIPRRSSHPFGSIAEKLFSVRSILGIDRQGSPWPWATRTGAAFPRDGRTQDPKDTTVGHLSVVSDTNFLSKGIHSRFDRWFGVPKWTVHLNRR